MHLAGDLSSAKKQTGETKIIHMLLSQLWLIVYKFQRKFNRGVTLFYVIKRLSWPKQPTYVFLEVILSGKNYSLMR